MVPLALAHRGAGSGGLRPHHPVSDEAIREYPPGPIEALAVRYYVQLTGEKSAQRRKDLAEHAAQTHPQSPLAWLMVADADALGDARQTALSRALALAPNDAEVLTRMALV